jgi:lysozyme family protein
MIGVNIPLLIKRNQARFDAMKINPGRVNGLVEVAERLCGSKDRFIAVEQRLIKLGFYAPWWFVAICAEREYGGPPHWDRQLSQGDPLSRVSWHDPAGRGPFFGNDAWERGCLDALIDCAPHAAKWKDWSAGGAATIWEEYNGLGYAAMGVPSAYVWSGSNQYISGKYIADHVYRAGVVDVQEGCMPILARMIAIDSTIHFGMPILQLAPQAGVA